MAEADRCVLCGLCLPHCPTYRATQDENESPRGRISLLRATASGALPASERLAEHLSLCLGCRACERVCPLGVRYGEILEAGRALVKIGRAPLPARMALQLVVRTRLLEAFGRMLRLYQRSGLQPLLRSSGLLRLLGLERLDAQLPPLPMARRWRARYPADGEPRGRVALFLGCVARVLDADTLAVAIRLLTRLGFEVLVPENQTCCGALQREAGEPGAASGLRTRNVAAFQSSNVDAVISVASGCGATLAEYGKEDRMAEGFATRLRDINAFLADAALPESLTLAPLDQTIAVQDPCSLRNALRGEQSVYRLLERIPGVRVVPLPENHLCCGGAGAYPLREPAMAVRLRAPKLAHLAAMRPSVLASANIGCALHLANGLRTQGLDIPIVHPLVLFERQLQPKTGLMADSCRAAAVSGKVKQ
jgi:glycolate oxidase iron-sulfur subunit